MHTTTKLQQCCAESGYLRHIKARILVKPKSQRRLLLFLGVEQLFHAQFQSLCTSLCDRPLPAFPPHSRPILQFSFSPSRDLKRCFIYSRICGVSKIGLIPPRSVQNHTRRIRLAGGGSAASRISSSVAPTKKSAAAAAARSLNMASITSRLSGKMNTCAAFSTASG